MDHTYAHHTMDPIDTMDDHDRDHVRGHNDDSRGSTTAPDIDIEAQTHSSSSKDASSRKHIMIQTPIDSAHDTLDSPVANKSLARSGTNLSKAGSVKSLRRRGRTGTHVAYTSAEMGRTTGWAPGLEPGIDTSDPPAYSEEDGVEHAQDIRRLELLQQQCEINVVDYSLDQMTTQCLDNENLSDFLDQPPEDWVEVRWINVNGLSWDVIKAIGKKKKLHRLAIEDLMNTRNRTKADWYHDHTYIVLPLQKLVNVEDEEESSDSDSDDDDNADRKHDYDAYLPKDDMKKTNSRGDAIDEGRRRRHALEHKHKRKGAIATLIKDMLHPKKPKSQKPQLTKTTSLNKNSKVRTPWVPKKVRTLQQYHAGVNQDRIDFMHRHSTLGAKGLGVSIEQVSIFLMADNTVISFFEYSAQDVEIPILRRLQSRSTILRQSCDASMLMQSILDTIIDLAIPVTTAYQDAIGDLELSVLTNPEITESTQLYILTSEIAVLRSTIAPVNQLIDALKDHKSSAAVVHMPVASARTPGASTPSLRPAATQNASSQRPEYFSQQTSRSTNMQTGVSVSPLTITYLGDVEDHARLITDNYDQMRRNADNLVDLIFNTVSAYQNESMKQLTIVTAFFLPLTFMTGYFGMNFHTFTGVQDHSDGYFWAIAGPVCAVVGLVLLREWITRWVVKWANKTLIKRGRKRRLEMAMD